MKRPIDRAKKQGPKPVSETVTGALCDTAAKQVAQFYRRWSKAARRHSGLHALRSAKAR
jgi:hypothetical protein